MTRSVVVLGSHSCQILPVDIVSLSMVTSTAPTLGSIITAPSQVCMSGDGRPADPDRSQPGLTQTDLAENGGDRPATNEPWSGVSQTMCTGQSGMAATRDND